MRTFASKSFQSHAEVLEELVYSLPYFTEAGTDSQDFKLPRPGSRGTRISYQASFPVSHSNIFCVWADKGKFLHYYITCSRSLAVKCAVAHSSLLSCLLIWVLLRDSSSVRAEKILEAMQIIPLIGRKGNKEPERNDQHKGTWLVNETRSSHIQSRTFSRMPHPQCQITAVSQELLLSIPHSVSHFTHFHA